MTKLGWIAIVIGAAACGGGGTGPLSRDDAQDLCQRTCAKEASCDGTTNVDACVADCVGDIGSGAFQEGAVGDLVDCLEDLDCSQNEAQCFTTCTPTDAHEAYEARCRTRIVDCGGDAGNADQICETTPSGTTDDGFVCLLTPEVMDELRACYDEPCDQVGACLQLVSQRYGIGN